jgi:hypothetical protein
LEPFQAGREAASMPAGFGIEERSDEVQKPAGIEAVRRRGRPKFTKLAVVSLGR